VRTNQTATGPCDSNSGSRGIMALDTGLSRPTVPAKLRERGGGIRTVNLDT
jgi:hypothetical protein